jgi:hypothetical protein
MRTLLLMAAIACAAAGCQPAPAGGPAAGGEMPRSVIDPYLKIETALANDTTDGIRANAGDIATAATALGAPAMKIDTAAVQLASAGDLEDARAKFGELSSAIDGYMTGLHLTVPEGVRVAFCPMAQKPWMQKGDILANPYYGKAMPLCGEFR